MPGATTRVPRTRIERDCRQNVRAIHRTIGEEIANARRDFGVSLSRLAEASGVAKSYLHEIEAGEAAASVDVLAALSAALGGRLSVRFTPGTGSALRDRYQAAMAEALLRVLHPRWRRMPEVAVYRPVRGVIDVVLDDPDEEVLVASEIQSQMRRFEQQLRWAKAKAEALGAQGSHEVAGFVNGTRRVSRLLLLRNTQANRAVIQLHPELIAAAYPARYEDALASLSGTAPWPGAALLRADVNGSDARILPRPPRGIVRR